MRMPLVLRNFVFSIDYEPTGDVPVDEYVDNAAAVESDRFTDDDGDDERDDADGAWRASSTQHGADLNHTSPRYSRYLIGLLCVLLILVLAPTVSRDRRKENDSSSSNPGANDKSSTDTTTSNGATTQDSCPDNLRNPIYQYRSTASLQNLPHGAVAADHELCSQMGTAMLRDAGGNAADAAVTTALCLGVANPASSGLGGGGFILVHGDVNDDSNNKDGPVFRDAREETTRATADSSKTTEAIDCREVAPAAATTNMFLDDPNPQASLFGGLAAGVPAELRGLEVLHARYGSLPWATVVQPVATLARAGVPVNGNLAHEIQFMASWYSKKNIAGYGLRKLLTHNDDWTQPLQEGDVLRNEKLADTLEAVMNEGSKALYQGFRAEGLARDIRNVGGIMTAQDLENYVPTLRSPVVAHDIHGFSIAGVPPPSSGGAAIVAIARFLAGYATPLASFADTLSVHRFVEACRHVFAMRMSLSDPDYHTEIVKDVVHDMVQGTYIDDLRSDTHDNTTLPLSQYGGSKWAQLNDTDGDGDAHDAKEGDRRRLRQLWREFGYLEDHGTSHFSVVDASGNAVAMTTSVNTYFGSQIVSESTGLIVNNQMDDFATPGRPNGFGLAPAESNYIKPGKRPLSSMSPTMMFRRSDTHGEGSLGDLILVLGASGGPKIITAVVQVIINHILLGMPLFEATIHPRVHDQLIYHGAAVSTVEKSQLETGEPIAVRNRTIAALQSRNHDVLEVDYMGTVQSISVDLETNMLSASCDVRKGGSPDGY